MNRSTTIGVTHLSDTVPAALAALLLGAVILFGAGLSQADLLHAAAHDGRHAFAFPCH